MKVHRPPALNYRDQLTNAFRRVVDAALDAGLDTESFHELVDDEWAHTFHRALSAARTNDDRLADLLRWKWKAHALHRIHEHANTNTKESK